MNIIIYKNKNIPIYEQITTQIKYSILNGALQPGDMILSMRALAKHLGVSVVTVQRAYDELLHERIIETIPAKGSFISEQCHIHLRHDLERQLDVHIERLKETARMLDMTNEELMQKIIRGNERE